jgi:transglutaminase-like putative cysteine protease
MSWRMRVKHETEIHYAGNVVGSYNEVRITPPTTGAQEALESRIEVSPGAALTHYVDYWGTQVTAFDLHEVHDLLRITGLSVVETSDGHDADTSADWDAVGSPEVSGRFVELLRPTPLTRIDRSLVTEARRIAAGLSPHEAALALAAHVGERVSYVPGATEVSTGAQDAYTQGAGVCQDMAHLTVAMLRSAGLPARYVSGYLHPDAEAGVRHMADGESHAWVEWWAGGWIPWDPTNGIPVGEQHVFVAAGRDYADVPPIKGICRGAGSTHQVVRVEVERLA